MRIFRCNFAKFSWWHAPGPSRMVVPSALPLKLVCDVVPLWRNLTLLGNFLRRPETYTPRSAQKTDLDEKKLNGSPGHMRKNATTVTRSEHLKIYYHAIVTQWRSRVGYNNPLASFATCLCRQGERTWVNCAVVLSVSGTLPWWASGSFIWPCLHA